MAAQIAPASVTMATAEVNLPDYALPCEFIGLIGDRADEFMARHALKAHVAFKNLQIGGTNAGEMNFDDSSRRERANASRPYDLRSVIFRRRVK